MARYRAGYEVIAILSLFVTARSQILNNDLRFPVLNELRWEMSINEARSLCETRHVLESSSDTTVIAGMRFFGIPARIEIAYFRGPASISHIEVKFKNPTREIEDTLVSHFTLLTGKAPFRQTKEKSIIIMTIKMEVAAWNLPTETVNLITAKRNDEIFDVHLSLLPHPMR